MGSFFIRYFQEPPIADASVQAIEWEDVDEGEEPSSLNIPALPQLKENENKTIENDDVQEKAKDDPLEEEVTPILADDDEIPTAKLQEIVQDPVKSNQVIIVKALQGNATLQMGQPPKLVTDFYPPTDLVSFHGRVSVFATIGKDGNVIKTKIAVTSGKYSVDQIAMSAVRRWTFKPALDQNGKPMECTKIISIPFNVPQKN